MNTTVTNDLCNEVRDLREQLADMTMARDVGMQAHAKLCNLLVAVLDAGRPHSHLCGCDMCAAFEAVRKELRGE